MGILSERKLWLRDVRTKELLSLLFAILCFLFLLRAFTLGGYPDFPTFYFAPFAALTGGDPFIPGYGYTEFLYPPFSLLFFSSLHLMTLILASKIWLGISVILLLLSLFFLFRTVGKKRVDAFALCIAGLVFIAFPVKFTLGMGQVNMLVLCLVVLCIYAYLQQRWRLSGMFLGLSLAIKAFPILLIIYFLLRKRWSVAVFAIAWFAGLQLITLLFFPELTVRYFTEILPSLGTSVKTSYYNQALSGFIYRLPGNTDFLHMLLLFFSALLFVFSCFIVLKYVTQKNELIGLSFFITLSILINTFSWQHHFVLLIIPLVILASRTLQIKMQKAFLLSVLMVSYMLAMGNVQIPYTVPLVIQSHGFFGALLLWGICSYLLIKKYG